MLRRIYGLEYEDVTWLLLQIQVFTQGHTKEVLPAFFKILVFLDSSTLTSKTLQAYEKASVTTDQPTRINAPEKLNVQILILISSLK
jgi:hypothetical protein